MGCLASFPLSEIDIHEDQIKEIVALRFGRGDGDYFEVQMPKQGMASLFLRILETLKLDPPAPMREDHMGGIAMPERHDTQRLPDGDVALRIHLRTDDGQRTMTWKMPPDAAIKLAGALTQSANAPDY